MVNYRSKELSIFYQKMSQLYRSGIPLTEGLKLATLDIKDNRLRLSLERTHNYVMTGRSLTESLAQSPQSFSDLDLAIIGVGETQGRLDQSLLNLANLYEEKYKDLKIFLLAMLYPAVLLLAAIFIPPIVTGYNEGLTAYIYASGSTFAKIIVPLAGIYALYYSFQVYAPEAFDRLIISLPIIGSNLQKLAIARFSRSLSTLFASGVDLRKSVKLAAKSLANKYMESRCHILEVAIDEGRNISDGLIAAKIFPSNFIQTFIVGERTGDLDKMLDQVAKYYEFEADKAFKAILTLLPIVVYLLVAAYIGYIVISFYTGYFNAIGSITQ